MEKYFETQDELFTYLQETLGFSEEDSEDCLDDLAEYEEDTHKRTLVVSGFIRNPADDFYYFVTYDSDYDWGSSDFCLDTTKRRLVKETKMVEVTENKYIPVEKV